MGAPVARIRRYGHGGLRRRARSVDPADPGTRQLLDTLWATLTADGGVGLAAPQVNRNCRVVIVLDLERPRGKQRLELVNPVVRETFGPQVPFEEGCLSFPGLYLKVLRPQGAVVEFDGPQGRCTLREEGLAARIIQHEVDHLDGVVFTDHLSAWQRTLLRPRLLTFALTEAWLSRFSKQRGDQ